MSILVSLMLTPDYLVCRCPNSHWASGPAATPTSSQQKQKREQTTMKAAGRRFVAGRRARG
jgi:hypothetical protein